MQKAGGGGRRRSSPCFWRILMIHPLLRTILAGAILLTASVQLWFSTAHLKTEESSSSSSAVSGFIYNGKVNFVVKQSSNKDDKDENDKDCIFRDSPLYRSVFVYPSPGEKEWEDLADTILSTQGKSFSHRYPWQDIEDRTRANGEYHFRLKDARAIQYTTELLVRDILTHPDSCLRSNDPETASLFYVPYLVSMEWHNGTQYPKNFETSPYGQAIIDVIDQDDYSKWEQIWGYTSKYWKRNHGADHILVMSEGCHGLSHPQARSGNYIFIEAQKQLSPPIVIFKDTSKTFGNMYPNCAAKNIVIPAPNPDGRWFNGRVDDMAKVLSQNAGMDQDDNPARLPQDPLHRPLAYYYKAGNHGSCRTLRQSLEATFDCSPSHQLLQKKLKAKLLPKGYHFPHAFRHATFCPCPGGDTPNAKRYFDAVLAGCIPLILSSDFVWPYSEEIPGAPQLVNPDRFSLRLDPQQFTIFQTPGGNDDKEQREKVISKVCETRDSKKMGTLGESLPQTIQDYISSLSSTEIERLQRGVQEAAPYFQWYRTSPTLPDNPLRERVLPDGLAAMALVGALADRAGGNRWPACQEELRNINPRDDSVHMYRC